MEFSNVGPCIVGVFIIRDDFYHYRHFFENGEIKSKINMYMHTIFVSQDKQINLIERYPYKRSQIWVF